MKPQRNELLVRLGYVLEFIVANLVKLEQHARYWGEDKGGIGRLEDKVASESALLLLLANNVPTPPAELVQLTSQLAELLTRHIRSDHNRIIIMRNPQNVLPLATGHILLTQAGYGDEAWSAFIGRLLDQGYGDIKERYPHRQLDKIWLSALAGRRDKFDAAQVVPTTLICSDTHPFYMSSGDAYAYTHIPMYLTDFGRRALPDEVDKRRVGAVLDAALAWQILAIDFDLLGEFLVDVVLLRQGWTPHAHVAWRTLATTWDALGFLPGPSFDQHRFAELAGAERSAYAFKEMYHTNLVGGVLCALLLSADDDSDLPPEPAWAHQPAVLAEADRVVERALAFCTAVRPLTDRERTARPPAPADPRQRLLALALKVANHTGKQMPRWTDALATADVTDREAAAVLLDGIFVLGVRNYDLAAVAEALYIFMDLALAPTLTFLETLRFLTNQQVPSGAVGAQFVLEENGQKPEAREITLTLALCLQRARAYAASYDAAA